MSHDDRPQTPGEGFRDAVPPGADAVEPRDPNVRAIPREPSKALWYAVPAVLLVVLGLGWMLWSELGANRGLERDAIGTTGERGPAGDTVLNPRPAGPPVISNMELLADAESYVGRTARFAAVPVSTKHGDRTFSVGRIGSRAVVLAEPGADIRGLSTGDPVSLEGTIERAPSSEELGRMGLAADDREALEDADVYIRATRVEPVAQDVGSSQAETPRDD